MKLSKKVAKITAAITGAVALGTVATATTANADSIYTVQAGDTLSGISYKLGHDLTFVDTLANNNNIADKNLIYVGQQLVIKDDGEVAPATQKKLLLYQPQMLHHKQIHKLHLLKIKHNKTNKYNQTKKHQLLNNKYKLHKHKMYNNNLVLKHQLAITQM